MSITFNKKLPTYVFVGSLFSFNFTGVVGKDLLRQYDNALLCVEPYFLSLAKQM